MRFDPIWRRIKPDSFTAKLEGRFPQRVARLDELNNWGVLRWLYPHASATKLAHHYGLERNAMQFLNGDAEREKYRASLRTAAHVMHWGHLPLSYAAEEAVLRAAHVEPKVAAVITKIMDDVVAAGDLPCEVEGHDCVSSVRNGDRPFQLYRWLAAWQVKKDWNRVWAAIRDASTPAPVASEEIQTRVQLIQTLVCTENRGFRILSRCNQADYVPRDLLQAGTAWLTFDIEALWEPNPLGAEAASEWTLIDAAQQYLDDRFFHLPDSLLVHSLAARAIAGGLLAESFAAKTLETLLGQGDEYFFTKPKQYHRTRLSELRDLASSGRLRDKWSHVGSFRNVSLSEGSRFDMEDQLTGRKGGQRVSYPFSTRLDVSVGSNTPGLADAFAGGGRRFATVHVHHRVAETADDTTARQVLDIVAMLATCVAPSRQIGDALMSWLLGGVVEQRSEAVQRLCGELVSAQSKEVGRGVDRMRKLNALAPITSQLFFSGILSGFAGTTAFGGQQQRLSHLLLRLPWLALRSAGGVELLTLLRSSALARSAFGPKPARGYALELAVIADQWLAAGKPKERFVFMGSTLLGKDGLPAQEWDVVRVDLYGRDEWTLTATECAINRTAPKDDDAREKLDLLRTHLENRFRDLSTYRTFLATLKRGDLHYQDAARGFAPK